MLAAGATVAMLVLPALALGAVSELKSQGCISDVGDPAGCGATQQGLGGAGGVAVAADGRSVYAASVADNAIVRFDRDQTTGSLAAISCIADVGDLAGCGATEQGLSSAFGVVVAPDDRSVYVASEADSAVARFDRDINTGALTGQGCIDDPDDPAGCAASAQGLRNARGVAVSADGGSVYVVSSEGAIGRFDRDPMTGSLAAIGCIADTGDPAGCGTTQQGLAGAQGVAVSPDGRSVYVSSVTDDAIARFNRDPATLALTPAGCISDTGDPAGCGATAQGLDGARGVAVAPDGRSVYVAAETDDAIVRFDRDPASGALTAAGCISDTGDPAGCGTTQQGLDRAFGAAVSPNGSSVYVASQTDDAIARFNRDPTTLALTGAGCISDVGDPAGCGATAQGLDGARGVSISSAEGGSVYVTSSVDAAIVRFDRAPQVATDITPPAITLSGARTQAGSRFVKVKVESDEAAVVEGTGKIKVPVVNGARSTVLAAKRRSFKLKAVTKEITAGATETLKLKLPSKARKLTKRAQREGRKAKAKARVRATDAAGNESEERRQIKLRGKRS